MFWMFWWMLIFVWFHRSQHFTEWAKAQCAPMAQGRKSEDPWRFARHQFVGQLGDDTVSTWCSDKGTATVSPSQRFTPDSLTRGPTFRPPTILFLPSSSACTPQKNRCPSFLVCIWGELSVCLPLSWLSCSVTWQLCAEKIWKNMTQMRPCFCKTFLSCRQKRTKSFNTVYTSRVRARVFHRFSMLFCLNLEQRLRVWAGVYHINPLRSFMRSSTQRSMLNEEHASWFEYVPTPITVSRYTVLAILLGSQVCGISNSPLICCCFCRGVRLGGREGWIHLALKEETMMNDRCLVRKQIGSRLSFPFLMNSERVSSFTYRTAKMRPIQSNTEPTKMPAICGACSSVPVLYLDWKVNK